MKFRFAALLQFPIFVLCGAMIAIIAIIVLIRHLKGKPWVR
ncbi:MAG: hypothetical protein QXQ76_00990 [Candidatus Bathyarchaeia archaeon]